MNKQRTLDLQPQIINAELAESVVAKSIYRNAPSPDVIRMVYRKGDGKVNITRLRTPDDPPGPDMYLLAAIDAQQLPAFFEQDVALVQCTHDAYWQINPAGSVYKSINRHGIVDHRGELLHQPDTRTISVKSYNAVWVDLDVYNIGLRYSDAVWLALRAAEDGLLPQFSLAIDSGRGCWLMWVLHGSSPDLPAPRTPVNEKLWLATMGQLGKLFENLAYDKKAKNHSRVCRIDGSLNLKVHRRVGSLPWIDGETGKIITYGLPEIAEQFGVDLSRIPPIDVTVSEPQRTEPKRVAHETPYKLVAAPANANKDPNKVKGGITGHRARWKNLKDNLYKLMALRRVIRVGQREQTIFILAYVISKLNRKHEDPVQEAIDEIERNLMHLFEQPPGNEITLAKISTITRSTYRNKRSPDEKPMSEEHIADVLEITAAEEQALDYRLPRAGTRRPDLKVEQKKRAEANRQRRADQQAIVTAMVKANYEKSGQVPSVTAIQANLFANNMKAGASRRPCGDMRQAALVELGIEEPQRKKGAKPTTEPTLF